MMNIVLQYTKYLKKIEAIHFKVKQQMEGACKHCTTLGPFLAQ